MAPHGHQIAAGRQTILPPEDAEALASLEAVLADHGGGAPAEARRELSQVCARFPAFLDAWARLGQAAYLGGDHVTAYAFARVGYHRGLDRLRRNGWGGSGEVRWSELSNRGFLRSLHLLMLASAALGEEEENTRCRQFLLDLDPQDGIGVGRTDPLRTGQLAGAAELP